MADNIAVSAGTGTTIAADDVGGVLHQRVKVTWGPDGTANDADAASGKPLPVQLRDASGNAVAPASEAGGNLAAAAASLAILDDWDETDRAKVNIIAGQVGVAGGTGTDGATVQRVTLATNVGLPAGTANIGDVDVLTVPTDPFGATADAASATGSISAKLRAIATALGVTAQDLGVGTGGSRTQRVAVDSSQIPSSQVAAFLTSVGVVPVSLPSDWTQGVSAAVSLTRTADTNAYAANDVIGAATGSTAALTFASMGPSAGRVLLTSVELMIHVTAVPSGMTSFRLHLYNITPPSAYGDNVAWDLLTGDRASYLGYIDISMPLDLGGTLYMQMLGVNKQVKLAGTSLFGYLTTIGGFTPSSATVIMITLNGVVV